jgi:hypothetical protein
MDRDVSFTRGMKFDLRPGIRLLAAKSQQQEF